MSSQALSQPNEATPAPIRRLPHELLTLIFEYCDACPQRKSTLCALCLVSREFYKLAAPVLYRKVATTFGERSTSSPWYYREGQETSASKLSRTLATSWAVAEMVKVAEISTTRQDAGLFRDLTPTPTVKRIEVSLYHGARGPADYSEGALLTLAKAAPNLRILILHKLDDQLSTTLKKVAKLGNQFWEAWPKLEKVVVRKWRSEASPSHRKIAKDAKAWDVKIEPV
ncbi:hypothetical protein JCM10049v2_006210 [Rhodotorula toruloides]